MVIISNKAIRTTWVQRNVSPLATKMSSIFFQNREAIAWAIRATAENLTGRQQLVFKILLNQSKIILPQYKNIKFESIEHYHLSKKITTTKLLLIGAQFYQQTGKNDFTMIIQSAVRGKVKERVRFDAQSVNYDVILSEVKPRILRGLRRETTKESWEGLLIIQSFNLASSISKASRDELLYCIKKMTDIGGEIQAIIASLFMDVPINQLKNHIALSGIEKLKELSDSICKIIERYQIIKEVFEFNESRIFSDRKYICKKMSELLKLADMPESFLLFSLDKLSQARKTKKMETVDKIMDLFAEIRFLYAPLTERLGLVYLADDFRDQCLRLASPEKYEEVNKRVIQRIGMNYEEAKIYLSLAEKDIVDLLRDGLEKEYRSVQVKTRVKSPYSIWNKVEIRKEYPYGELNDVIGIKFICETLDQLKKIRDILKKDTQYIVRPASIKEVLEEAAEGWRGIKMIVDGPGNVPIEIQIMTEEMNLENMRGKAATWLYNLLKELKGTKQEFARTEPKEVITGNYIENFYQILKHWTVPVPGLK